MREILYPLLFYIWTFGPPVQKRNGGKMESTRDTRRLIGKEIRKGSAPLAFDHMEYEPDCLREIRSESKLKEVLSYLLRTAEYESLASGMTRNNVYTEKRLFGDTVFQRRNNAMERNASYLNAMGYAKRCVSGYDGKVFAETVPCYFSIPEENLDQYRFQYQGKETYAFPMSEKHIIRGLYLMCVIHRKSLAGMETPDFITLEKHRRIFHLAQIRNVLFQCLLLDDMHWKNGLFEAKFYTIYSLE